MTEAEAIKILRENLVEFKWQRDFPNDEEKIAAHYKAVIAAMHRAYELGRLHQRQYENEITNS